MNNKTLGNNFEQELSNMLFTNGYWVYNTINKASGQPADIIACRNNVVYLIECKVCSNDLFILSRIEENQYNAMRYFNACGNRETYFALKFADKSIYILHTLPLFLAKANGVKSIRKSDIESEPYGNLFDKWVRIQK